MLYGIVILVIVVALAVLAWTQLNIMLWITAVSSKVPVSFWALIGMKIKGIPSDVIINNMIRAYKAGIKVNSSDLESHYQAKGDLGKVISALISSRNAGLPLEFNVVKQLDLSGRDVSKVINAVITAKNGGLNLDLGTAAKIDLSGRDVEKIVKAVVTAKSAGLDLHVDTATQIDLSGRDVNKVLSNVIQARNAGINLDLDKAIQIDLSGRDLPKVINAIIAAQNAGLDLDLDMAVQIDLAGRDIVQAVRDAIQTKIIESEKERPIKALPKDGVEVKFASSITVKTNISELLSGAGSDETLLSRVEQKLVSKISSLNTYAEVLQNPVEIANILEPEDGKKRIDNSKMLLEEGINRWDTQEQKKAIIHDTEKEIDRKIEEINYKKADIEAIKKSEKEITQKIEETLHNTSDAELGLADELANERKRMEVERGKIIFEIRRIEEEKEKMEEMVRKLGEERNKIEDEAFNKFDTAAKEAVLGQEELADSHRDLLTGMIELKETYTELCKAYNFIKNVYETSVTRSDGLRKGLETANRELEMGKRKLEDADNELKKGRDHVSVVNSKLFDIQREINEGDAEFTIREMTIVTKKIEVARKDTVDGRRALEEALQDMESAFKTLMNLNKKSGVAQVPLEVAKKKINLVRRDLNPARKELEENTIYHVISVEIKNIELGHDKGAELEREQNKSNEEREKLAAELRRMDLDLKMKEAHIREIEVKHKLMEAEAKVNEALADAFKSGNFGALDYYRMKNMQADTRMRNNLAGDEEEKHE